MSGSDDVLSVTFFSDYAARQKVEARVTLCALASRIAATTAPAKDRLPWVKLARFGDMATAKGSLRHDRNVLGITGVEGDYDGEKISFDEAVEIAEKAGLLALIYTSPSHTAARPRWRILCTTSEEMAPSSRQRMMGRLAGLYRGIFAAESWALSQAYYFGSVNGNPDHRVEIVDGQPIDQLDELDRIAVGKPNTKPAGNGADHSASRPVDEAALLEEIRSSESYHTAAMRLLGAWARQGVSLVAAENSLRAAFDDVFPDDRNQRWHARLAEIPRMLEHVFGKEFENGARGADGHDNATNWGAPDMGVLRMHRRPPPRLPIEIFGSEWGRWITEAAAAAACPVDFVAAPLLAAVSVLIGHARWAQATQGWAEPPHLWIGSVGDSGDGKSPGADCLMRDVLPILEEKMLADFPDRLREWRARAEFDKATDEKWLSEVRDAVKRGSPAPSPPATRPTPEPLAPRLRQHDVTVEKVATLLSAAAPKGLLICRDELAGWIDGMTQYNDAGRSFWIEAYGGRPFRVERQKYPDPIDIPRLAVGVYGNTQPDKIAVLMRGADDGMLSRFLWVWPESIEFRLGRLPPRAQWAIGALDRLRELDLHPGPPAQPIMVPLAGDAVSLIETFGREMQKRQAEAIGLLRSALGKVRGQALRLSLILESLWWCGADGIAPAPAQISARAFAGADRLITDYFLPMAERTYGDAAATGADRGAATLAQWILKTHAAEVHVRHLQRDVRLPGLTRAELIHAAAEVLVEADWLSQPPKGTEFGPRARTAYRVNPDLWASAR